MKTDLIIYNASQLLTCASNGKPKRGAEMQNVGIIENGALAIKDAVIIAVGKFSEIVNNFESENVIDAHQKVVCPAFVDPHTHIVYAGNRLNEFELKIKGADYLEILENGGGILSTVRQTRETNLKDLVEQSLKRLDKLLELGVTTCEVKTGYGLDTETELKMLAAIFALDKIHTIDLIPTFLPAHAVPPEYKGKENDYVDLICNEMLPSAWRLFWMDKFDFEKIKSQIAEEIQLQEAKGESAGIGAFGIPESERLSVMQNNPFFIDVFCEKNAFNLEQSSRILEAGKRFGMKIKAHVDEFTNLGAARMAIELGATSIDHLDATSDEEIKLLANSETIGIVTPTVNFNFGSAEFADARKMIDAGCAIAVSTDYNPGSAPCPSPPLTMAIACRYQKLLPSEAFNAATINAAFGIGLGEKIGSLEVGKQADVLILDADDFRQVAYEFGGNFVESIVKKGKITSI
ncbi:MAG: imidazolonepropionase [Acidobacteriota bacterium]|nr:imidazolonepropionase [Acidobacteriota bacterium]